MEHEPLVIAVCVPNLGTISAACTRSVMAAQNACHVQGLPYSFLHVDVETVIIGKARALLTRVALDAGADRILMVDQDVAIPPHAIVALSGRDLPIVGGFYISRRQPYLPQIYTTDGTAGLEVGCSVTPRDVYWPVIDYPEEPILLEVDAIGAGCLMIKREVFESLAERQDNEDAALHSVMDAVQDFLPSGDYGLLEEHVRVMDPWWEFLTDEGEDMYFCRKARAAGYKVYVDLSVKCLHLGVVPIEEGHFKFIKPHLERQPSVEMKGGGE